MKGVLVIVFAKLQSSLSADTIELKPARDAKKLKQRGVTAMCSGCINYKANMGLWSNG